MSVTGSQRRGKSENRPRSGVWTSLRAFINDDWTFALMVKAILGLLPSPRYLYYSHNVESWSAPGYYSQYGQDKLIETLFAGLRDGVFVDIGAHDGVTFSNTFHLEKLGWTGLAVEPIPDVYLKLAQNRLCETVEGCVTASSGKARFRRCLGCTEMLSGIVSEYHPRHLQLIQRYIRDQGGTYEEIEVDCFRLNDLLDHFQIRHIDYLNIDVEGAELSILRDLDFSRVHISVIGVENNYSDYRIPRLLATKGFDFRFIAGCDSFFLNRSHAS